MPKKKHLTKKQRLRIEWDEWAAKVERDMNRNTGLWTTAIMRRIRKEKQNANNN